MECDGKHHHGRALEPAFGALGLPALDMQMRDHMIQRQQEQNANPESQEGGKEGEFSHCRGLCNGGDQQAPHGSCHHYPGGKSGQRPLNRVPEGIFHKEHTGSSKRGAQKRNQNSPKSFHIRSLPFAKTES